MIETVKLQLQNWFIVLFLLFYFVNPFFCNLLNLLDDRVEFETLLFNLKLVIIYLYLISDLFRNGKVSCKISRIQWNFNLLNLFSDMVVNVKQIASTFVSLLVSERLLHDDCFIDYGDLVVVKAPP